MSPSSKEIVTNRALSGAELRPILHAKLDSLIDNEGLLSAHVAYGRIAFTLTMALHLDNMMIRESKIEGSSAAPAVNDPDPTGLEAPPLVDPSSEAAISASQLDYKIDSPNVERLRYELPVNVDIRQQDGSVTQQTVKYPKDESLGDGAQTITDVTPAAKANWKK